MRESLVDYCTHSGLLPLLEEWDTEGNAPLTPVELSRGSKRRVWWKCKKGHRWQAMVYTRTGSGSGCPYCTGTLPSPGENDLATLYPHLAAQWDTELNAPQQPSQFLPGSHRQIWWRCEKGHLWKTRISSRVAGSKCPVCSNHALLAGENDLATCYPALAKEWNQEKNGDLTPDRVLPGNIRRIWWKCTYGHEWMARIDNRALYGHGCPVCSGRQVLPGENDLASQFPMVASQWHPTKNGPLSPQSVTAYSNRAVWWRCQLGHEFQATVARRTTYHTDCPYCTNKKVLPGFNDLATRCPELVSQWHPTLNGALSPQAVLPGSRHRAWWICGEGHVWKAAVYSRSGSQKCGCPVCAGRVRAPNYPSISTSDHEADIRILKEEVRT